MKRNWKDLGEVWSGRDLALGEVVTLNVFDKALNILLEQISYRAPDNRRAQYIWVQDFCRYINARSALVHAGTENAGGDWEILNSGYRNHYWNLSSRELLMTTTAPSAWNWNSQRCIPLHATHSLPIDTRMRLNVRSATDVLLETFLFELDWFGMHQWPRDLAEQVNAASRLVRAGRADGERIVPQAGATENAIWLPYNGNFKVSWFAETVSVDGEDDAGQGAQQPLLVFDYNADRLVEGAPVQQDIAAAERCKDYVLDDTSEEILEETDVVPTQDLKAKDRVKVNISIRGQDRVCETLTFAPVANRLKAGQWHHDLALQINAQSRYVKAWAEDETGKASGEGNVFWLPIWPSQELQVGIQVVASSSAALPTVVGETLDEVPLVGSDKCSVLWPCEPGRRAFTTAMSENNWVKGAALGAEPLVADQQVVIRVKGSKTGRILESLVFLPKEGRLDVQAWTEDLCSQVNGQCKFLRAGECNAKTFVIAASGSKDGNFFWTPAESGLVVEAEILSGFTLVGRGRLPTPSTGVEEELPGMTSEDKQLFDWYAESGRLISVDARTGLPTLNIPVAELYADDSLSQPLKVNLTFDQNVFIKLGNNAPFLAAGAGDHHYVVALRDGRRIQGSMDMGSDINGGDFILSRTVEKALDLEWDFTGFKVRYKDGGSDTFEVVATSNGKTVPAPLTEYRVVSGCGLQMEYDGVRLAKILKDGEALLEVKWGTHLSSIVVFPKSSTEKVTWTFSYESLTEGRIGIQADGLGSNGKVAYRICRDDSKRLISVEAEQRHAFTVDKKTETDKAVHKEVLEYDDTGKVKHHDICPGGGLDDLAHDYTYSDTGSVLTGYFKNATPKTVFTRTHVFSNGQSSEDKHGSTTVPIIRKQTHSLDDVDKCIVTTNEVSEGDVTVDKQTLTVDALGNPLSRGENDRTTRYTYYNNYQQYKVIKTEEKVHNTSLFGWLLKSLDYLNPVGWACLIGGKGGFSWGTYLKTKVDMTPAKNAYAKDAFALPVEIVHCGSDKPFSGDVESELVTRKVGNEEVAHSLTYFGYAKVNDQVMLTKKLTVLQPNYTKEDVAEQQLKAAKAAAKDLIENLEEEIKKASKENKTAFESALEALNNSLKAQSEVNREGYKLGEWKSASMSVETYEYHTDKTKAGYGTMKSIDRVLLGKDGKAVEASRRITTMDYSVDTEDANRVVIKTTVSGTGITDVVSSQTRSRHTGRLHASVDSQGVKTVYTYDGQGNLTSETTTKGEVSVRKTEATLVRNLGWQYEQVEGDTTSRLEKDVLGRRVKMWVKPQGADDFLETWRWVYDSCGRTITSVETDYGVDNKKISERQVNWTYDTTSGRIRIDNYLRGPDSKIIKTIKQTVVPAIKGECFTQGTFSIDRAYDPATNTLIEHYANTGSDGCKIKRSMTADGLMKAVSYIKVDTNKKESEVDKISFDHDKYGQMNKVMPKLGPTSSYEYDSVGRLLKTTRDVVRLVNKYDESTLATVSKSSRAEFTGLEAGARSVTLGDQSVDILGRVTTRTINLSQTEFSYVGGSTVSTLKSPPKTPTSLAGYSSNLDQATRTHTQTIKEGDVEQTSKLVFSTGGRVISFTDLTGEVTTYEYDVFNRLINSKNDHCQTTFVYADNGLLTSESINAVNAKMTMEVTYVYDALGQETGRNFTCEGLDTFAINRELLADGRVRKTSCKQGDREASYDRYEYDDSLRLEKWFANNDSDQFSYDNLGNMVGRMQYKYAYENSDVDARLIASITAPQSGTAEGRPEGKVTCDNEGRLISVGTLRVSYHDNGQVKTFSRDADKTQYAFSYDAEGRVRGGSIGTKTDTFHYRGECVYALVQSDSGKSAGFSTRTLVLRNDSRACLMQDALVDGDDSKTTRSFELRDAAGTVFASIDLASKSVTLFRYTPYGKRTHGEKATTWLGFKGEPLMGSTGLYYLGNGYRAYNPDWGRFLTRDSLSPFGAGGVNAYVFGADDPVNYHDPSGHQIVAQYERWSTAPLMESTAFRVVVGALSLVIAPFTAGMSALLAVASTALAAVSFSLDVASIILAESDPELARTLETWGHVFGIAGAAAGIAMMVHGWKGMPRNWFKVRGTPPPRAAAQIFKPPSELLAAQLARTRAINGMVLAVEEARAAGTFQAFKARYLLPDPTMSSGVRVAASSGASLGGRLNNSTKNLFTGVIREADDSLWDALGTLLDMNSGPSTLVSKFQTPPPGETGLVSIVGGPFPGREKLFP